jgi:hypothetical protein
VTALRAAQVVVVAAMEEELNGQVAMPMECRHDAEQVKDLSTTAEPMR